MNALHQLQTAFQDYVLGDGVAAPALLASVRRQGSKDSQARLAIYHHAYRARMRDALGEAYERTWRYIGDALFAQLSDAYLDAHPSSFSNLRWFGGGFADFVAQQLPEHGFVAELARFEWTLGLAFDAPDMAPASMDGLRQLAPEQWAALCFSLHPSAQLLRMRYNSVALWQALGEEGDPPSPVELEAPLTWLVWRRALQPHFRSLERFEADALDALARGDSFGALCERAAATEAQAAARVAACLRDWLGSELLREVEAGPHAYHPDQA